MLLLGMVRLLLRVDKAHAVQAGRRRGGGGSHECLGCADVARVQEEGVAVEVICRAGGRQGSGCGDAWVVVVHGGQCGWGVYRCRVEMRIGVIVVHWGCGGGVVWMPLILDALRLSAV